MYSFVVCLPLDFVATVGLALAVRLHAYACAREVCRAYVGCFAVKNNHLEVYHWAESAL